MIQKNNNNNQDDRPIESQRRKKKERLSSLRDYRTNYSIEYFIEDFVKYFDGEVDFNLDKILQRMERPGILEDLIKKAEEKNTHPVTEFVQDLFKELGKSGDVEWSGEL
ncbi:MAG: hypothetical protein JW867_02115 [Candidatus Omnitrophica bacterium]|nr:hypothetical protein [Candidatus Omnitrophota bacterium]